jgi:hypothetical protein
MIGLVIDLVMDLVVDLVGVRWSVSKIVRIALLVSDNSTATIAIFTAVTHWSLSEWRHSPGQQPPVFTGTFRALITKSAISHYF